VNLLSSYSSLATPECADGILSLICRYLYRPCSTDLRIIPSTTVTLNECLTLKDHVCRQEWPHVELFFAASSCLISFGGCNLDGVYLTDQTRTVQYSTGLSVSSSDIRCDRVFIFLYAQTTVPSKSNGADTVGKSCSVHAVNTVLTFHSVSRFRSRE
jgi:hypothetical protein